MSLDFTIRQAQSADIPLLIQARVDFLAALGHPIPDDKLKETQKRLQTFITQSLNRDLFAWIALDDSQIAAAGFLQVFQIMVHGNAPSGRYGRIVNVLTWEAYRSQGLGRRIMNQLIAKARQLGLDYISLNASDLGRPLYESLGFVDDVPEDPPMILHL